MKGHRQGETAPLWLVGWSCRQAARAGAARSLERPHPSSPRGIAHQKLSGCWQGPQRVPTLTAAELHAGTPPAPPRERRASSRAGCSQEDRVFLQGLCQARRRGESRGRGELPSRDLCDASQQTQAHVGVGCSAEANRSVPNCLRSQSSPPAPDLTPPQGPHPCFPLNCSTRHPRRQFRRDRGDSRGRSGRGLPLAVLLPRQHIWLLSAPAAEILPCKCHPPTRGARGGPQPPQLEPHLGSRRQPRQMLFRREFRELRVTIAFW